MATRGDETRSRLFKLYAQNLNIHCPSIENQFVCPICTERFDEEAVLHEKLKVDVGHAFPKKLGGNHKTLECRACNGRLNLAADNELIRHHQQWQAVQDPDARPTQGFIEMPSGRVNIDVSLRRVHAHFARSNPAAFQEAVDRIKNGTPPKMSLPPTDLGRLNLALLHSAHLLFFRQFAYGYLGSPVGQYISNIINTSDRLDNAPFAVLDIPRETIDASLVFRLGVYTYRDKTRCLFVSLPSADPTYACKLIILPGLWENDIKHFSTVLERANSWVQGEFRTIDGGSQRRLLAPEYWNSLFLLWNGWTHQNIDATKLMYAIHDEANGSLKRRVDAMPIAARFGIRRENLTEYIASLAARGFLERAPRSRRLFLVRMTGKGRDGIQPKHVARELAKQN